MALDGRPVAFRNPADAIAAGVGLLPADRQREGAFMVRPVAENLAAPSWGRLAGRGGVITRRREAQAYRRWHDELNIRSRNDPAQALATLSGGNQQKVLLGRWLERESRLLAADRADARRRRGRAAGDLPRDPRARARRASASSSPRRTTRRSCRWPTAPP